MYLPSTVGQPFPYQSASEAVACTQADMSLSLWFTSTMGAIVGGLIGATGIAQIVPGWFTGVSTMPIGEPSAADIGIGALLGAVTGAFIPATVGQQQVGAACRPVTLLSQIGQVGLWSLFGGGMGYAVGEIVAQTSQAISPKDSADSNRKQLVDTSAAIGLGTGAILSAFFSVGSQF